MKRFASIDIGTNTVRLLILEGGDSGSLKELESARRITRLGEGMDTGKRLLPERMDLTVQVLSEFQQILSLYQPLTLRAVATSAIREASNGAEFVEKVQQHTGIAIEVIPWEEEARLTLEGVFWNIEHQNRPALSFDIGGGSTEFILSEGNKMQQAQGTLLGTVRMTERFLTCHPVEESEYNAMRDHIRAGLHEVKNGLNAFQPELLVGTAGTVTTLAALDLDLFPYDPQKIHGHVLSRDRIRAIQNGLKSRSLAERLELKPLERGREDLIIAGGLLVLETMRAFGCERLTVSEYGLREGIILAQVKPSANRTDGRGRS